MNRIPEWGARIFIAALILGVFLALASWRLLDRRRIIEVHAAMPEAGGWTPESLVVKAGEPLNLRLVSDDVVHGFAIGQSDQPEVELNPGQPVETRLVFDKPGKYVYYCTRWCGPNHWRMRGVIEVTRDAVEDNAQPSPLYVDLNLDLDAEHIADVKPSRTPSAASGAALDVELPAFYHSKTYYQTHSPTQAWLDLRTETDLAALEDEQLWDLVAYIWNMQTSPSTLTDGQGLYAANCAACHGETGRGDGVMAASLIGISPDEENQSGTRDHQNEMSGHSKTTPTDFTDPNHMLGASPAVLHGKIMRGGMGTGMPYWGPIFTEEQIWSIVSFLWTYQFQFSEVRE